MHEVCLSGCSCRQELLSAAPKFSKTPRYFLGSPLWKAGSRDGAKWGKKLSPTKTTEWQTWTSNSPKLVVMKVPPARRLWDALHVTRHFDFKYVCGFSQQHTARPFPFGHAASGPRVPVGKCREVSEQPRLKGHRCPCDVWDHKVTPEALSQCRFPRASAVSD